MSRTFPWAIVGFDDQNMFGSAPRVPGRLGVFKCFEGCHPCKALQTSPMPQTHLARLPTQKVINGLCHPRCGLVQGLKVDWALATGRSELVRHMVSELLQHATQEIYDL